MRKRPGAAGGYLAGFDVVVNCVLQNTSAPLMFVTGDDLAAFSPGSLIVDGHVTREWASAGRGPHRFAEPMFTVGSNIYYYAVDHSPSPGLWNSATWEISQALLPHLAAVLGGPGAWDSDPVIQRAIEIRDGVIQNPDILSFQHRAPQYPHLRLP